MLSFLQQIFIHLVIILCTAVAYTQPSLPTPQPLLRAETLLDSSRYEEALNLALGLEEAMQTIYADDLYLNIRYLNLLGNCYLDKGEFEKAFPPFVKAKDLLEAGGGNHSLPFAQTLNNLGNYYFQTGDFEQALNSHQIALDIRLQRLGQKHPDVADSYNNIANCFQVGGVYEQALAYYQQALDIRQGHWQNDHPDIASVLNNMGNSWLSLGDPQSAIDYYRQALRMREALLSPQHLKTIGSYQSLGNAFLTDRQLDSAHFYTQLSLRTLENNYPDQQAQIANLYNILGNISTEGHNFLQARTYLDSALHIQQEVYGQDHLSLADTYQNMADAFYGNGNYRQALLYYRRANGIYRQHLGVGHPVMASVWDKIGLSLRSLEDFESALNAHHRALSQRQDFFGESHPFVAGTQINIGNCYWQMEKYQPALDYYEKSLAILEKQEGTSLLEFNRLYNNIGNCYYEMREFSLALEYYEKAGRSIPSGHSTQMVVYYKHLGMTYSQQGQYARASSVFQSGLTLAVEKREDLVSMLPVETLFLQNASAKNLLRHYQSEQNQSALKLAYAAYREAVESLDQIWQSYLSVDARQQLNDEHYSLFEGAIETCYELWQQTDSLHYLEEAFLLSEKSKSSRLLSAVRTNQAAILSHIPEDYANQLRQLESDIATQEKQRHKLSGQSVSDYKKIIKIDSTLVQLRQELERLQRKLREEFPAYRNLMADQGLASLSDVQKRLSKDAGKMLAFFNGEENIYVFVVKQEEVSLVKIPLDFPLESWLEELGNSIILYPFVGSKESRQLDSVYTFYAHQFFQKLWQPISVQAETANKITIIPDGLLSYLPFEVLLSNMPTKPQRYRNYPFLLKTYNISYAYSATLLAEAQSRPTSKARGKWLGMAPIFENNSLNLTPLDHNQSEVRAIQSLIGGDFLLGQEATVAAFLKQAPKYRLLHLATHAMSNKDYGQFAFLAFSKSPDSLEQEQLFANDLYHQYLPAELVVLSACETGFGNLIDRSEGIASLARSFSYAGAKSVITTLWSVNDAKTARFMEDFYRRLIKGQPKNRALWESKLNYIENAAHDDAHPFFWAAYLPIGDMGKIDQGVDWWIGLLVLLLGIRLFFYLKKQ